MLIENIIFYILLVDALLANLLVIWGFGARWQTEFGLLGRLLPLTRGWTTLYLALVLFAGWILYASGNLYVPTL